MKSDRQLCRSLIEQPEGSQRWDLAYQLLLRWMQESEESDCSHTSSYFLEKSHENSYLCPCFDPTPTTKSDN